MGGSERRVQKKIWTKPLRVHWISLHQETRRDREFRGRSALWWPLVDSADNPNRRSCVIRKATAGLDEVITLWRVALELTPSDHRERPSTLVNISDRLKEWFRKLGFVVDLADSINLRRAASELALPRNHDHPPSRIALDEATKLMRAALIFFPTGHADCIDSLRNSSLRPMYTLTGVFWVEARRYHHLRVATSTLKSAKRSQPSWGILRYLTDGVRGATTT